MTIHQEPAELPRSDLDTRPIRPWSNSEIAMAIAAGVITVLAFAVFCLAWGGR